MVNIDTSVVSTFLEYSMYHVHRQLVFRAALHTFMLVWQLLKPTPQSRLAFGRCNMAWTGNVDKCVTCVEIDMVASVQSMVPELHYVIPQPKREEWLSCVDLQSIIRQMWQGFKPNDEQSHSFMLFCYNSDATCGPQLVNVNKSAIMQEYYHSLSNSIQGTTLKLVACMIDSQQ
jgi:hypothetical protein